MGRAMKVSRVAVADFPDYAVSNTGLVRRIVDDVILTQRPSDGGYLRVRLWRDGEPRYLRVHLLVLEAFKGPRPTARHHGAHAPDRSKWNNTIANLRWATPEENEADKKPHGTAKGGGKVKPLSPAEVIFARFWHSRAVRGEHHKTVAA
jgi:hypothetical protein